MEEFKKEHSEGMGHHAHGTMCAGMGCCCGSRYGLLRWVIGIGILLIVFWGGVKIGELKGLYEGQGGFYGHGMFRERGMMMQRGGQYPPGYDMMGAPQPQQSTTTP